LEVHVNWFSRAMLSVAACGAIGDDGARPALSRPRWVAERRGCRSSNSPVHSGRDERLRRVDQPRHRYGE
jgi:hypothetical protein